MDQKREKELLRECIDLLRGMDIDRLKYELSRETGPLSADLIDAEDEQKKAPPEADIKVSEDKMKAWMTVVNPGKPRAISMEYFFQQLTVNGVKCGILEDNLEKILDRNVFQQEVLVAEGRLPENGKDGKIILLINQSEDPEECLDIRGRIDFKKMRLKNVVRAGEVIAERIPPVPGKPGYKVDGDAIPAKPVNEAAFKLTPDVEISRENDMQLVALKDGIFYPDFTIRDLTVINGDIDFNTGNIQFAKSLLIKGDVKAGFTVYSGGDIEISRCVEDSRVSALGSVIVKEGFLGTGKGLIRGKNIKIGHIKQQKVMAIEDIIVGGEVMYANLQASGFIRLMGIKGIAIGSVLIAGKGIELSHAGNAQNIKTHLCAGYNSDILITDKRIQQMVEYISKAEDGLRVFHAVKTPEHLPQKSRNMMERLEVTHKYMNEELSKLQNKRTAQIDELVEREKPYIKVTGTVFPNTTIQIGDVKTYVDKELRNKLFVLHKDRILEMAASSIHRGNLPTG